LAARRRNLFVVPEEIQPPDVIQYLHEELDRTAGRLWCEPGDALGRVLGNPEVCELHMSMLPALNATEDPLQRHAREGLILKCQRQGQHALTAKEKRELLLNADAIEALRNSAGQQVLAE
jgi:membrane glycosyltransferase